MFIHIIVWLLDQMDQQSKPKKIIYENFKKML